MKHISEIRCLIHPQREAVAVCPECKRYFCRECITEHEEKVLCASCLAVKLRSSVEKKSRFAGIVKTCQFLFGFALLWMLFILLGKMLIAIPSSFHEGTVWKDFLK